MTGPWDRQPDCPATIALEMIGKIGRERAAIYMVRRLLKARSWAEARQGWRLLAAVIAA